MPNVSSTSLTTLSLAGTPTVRLSSFTGGEGEQVTSPRTDSIQFTALHVNAMAGKTRTFLPKSDDVGQDNLLLLGVS